MGTYDIGWIELIIGCSFIILPVIIFWYYKTKLVKTLCISFLRMALQLSLVGVYLQLIFNLNSKILNIAWTAVMLFAACFTIIKRSNLRIKCFILPVFIGAFIDLFINCMIFAFIAIGASQFFDARYIIPISGMIIGNCITTTIIALQSFYSNVSKNSDKYLYFLSLGASRHEALFPYLRDALKTAFNPTIASTATVGLVWLPGMMTGQILGGSNPMTAIKYQIMILVSIFAGSVITAFCSLRMSIPNAFDANDMIKPEVFRK